MTSLDILQGIEGFDWDQGNREKNWIKHHVKTHEVEEIFFNKPLLISPDPKHSQTEERFRALGKTSAGRLLFVGFTVRNKLVRPISTRDQNQKERKDYAKSETNP